MPVTDDEGTSTVFVFGPAGAGYGRVAMAYAECGREDELIPNVNLIAAAPELLEEEENNLLLLKSTYDAIKSLDILAFGEVKPTSECPGWPIRDELLHEIASRIKATETAIAKAKGE